MASKRKHTQSVMTSGQNNRDAHMDEAFFTAEKTVPLVQGFLTLFCTVLNITIDEYQVICPCAGTGRLTKGFIDARLFDRNEAPGITVREYMDLTVKDIGDQKALVFENPPFGQHNAVPFFNKMASFPQVEYMALIFPDKYRNHHEHPHDHRVVMNEYFHCVEYRHLPKGSFDDASGKTVVINTSFQLWKRKIIKREQLLWNGPVFWVETGLDPNKKRSKKNRRRGIVTISKTKHTSFRIQIPTGHTKTDLMMCLKKCRQEYPHYTGLTFHVGNLKNTIVNSL